MRTLILFLCVCVPAFADELTLKNGDKLTGTVIDAAGGKLTFRTAHSGDLKIDWKEIATLKTDDKVTLKLASGQIVAGTLSTQDGKLFVGGDTEIPWDQVAKINEPPRAWHGSVDLAARATDGNTHTSSILLAADGLYALEADEFYLKGVFRYGEASGDINERNTYLLGRYRRTFTEKFFGYGSLEFLSDTFRDLELRTIYSAGGGYVVEATPGRDIKLELGLAYTDNNFVVGDDDSFMGARVHVAVRWAVGHGLEVTNLLTWYPNFEDGSDWTAHNEFAVGTALGAGWSFKAGIITDIDNEVPDGVEKKDDIFFVGLNYKY